MAAKSKPLPPGVYTPVLTLYKNTPEQEINLDAMYKHGQYLVRQGMHGLVYLGTNGELALLDREERQSILRTAVQAVKDLGLPNYPIVAGISAQSTKETIRNAKDAAEAGAGWALLLPPSYWAKALSEAALLGYYREVADASPLPIVIYNFPGVTSGIDLDSDQISSLASHPNIVAVKLTCGNVGKVCRLTPKFKPDVFGVYGGSADYLLPTLQAGGAGCVTGMGNVWPASTAGIYELFKAGQIEEAQKLQSEVAAAEWACKKGLSLTKFGAWHFLGRPHLGIDDAAVFAPRKPYLPVNEERQKWTIQTMEVLGESEARVGKEFGLGQNAGKKGASVDAGMNGAS